MNSTKRKLWKAGLLSIFIVSWFLNLQGQVQLDVSKIVGHPRLLLPAGEEKRIEAEIKREPAWEKVHNAILSECDLMLGLKPMERKMIGRRLLQSSRESLRRIFFLSYAWRMTQKQPYFDKCEAELLAISAYSDWNPDHFLDVAEMTMAAAIGYDWLYNKLPENSRSVIRKAIVEKGLQPSLNSKYNGWLRGSNNWNQVCNGGITFGALAIYENESKMVEELIQRAIKSILIPMKTYQPMGNYAEGYSYWGYGTSFNVFFIAALDNIFKTNFGLSAQPGFLGTASFYQNLTGSTGLPFNYSDNGGNEGLQPAMFWFADQLKDPSLLYIEKQYLLNLRLNIKNNRFLPAVMLWGKGISPAEIKAPESTFLEAKGINEVAVLRTGWKENDLYVGVKAGSPGLSHAHMDVGSFIMDANGVRWASDFGMQNYNSLESAGLKIWDMSQNSQRWQVFRYTNLVHNTLSINNHHQNVKGNAKIDIRNTDKANIRVMMDLSSLYNEDLKEARRGIALIDQQYLAIRDEVMTGDQECIIRWTMLTPATVSGINGNHLLLRSKGKKLAVVVKDVDGVELKTWSTAAPHPYDAPNPGTTLIGFEIKLPPRTKKAFTVLLIPEERGKEQPDVEPLSKW